MTKGDDAQLLQLLSRLKVDPPAEGFTRALRARLDWESQLGRLRSEPPEAEFASMLQARLAEANLAHGAAAKSEVGRRLTGARGWIAATATVLLFGGVAAAGGGEALNHWVQRVTVRWSDPVSTAEPDITRPPATDHKPEKTSPQANTSETTSLSVDEPLASPPTSSSLPTQDPEPALPPNSQVSRLPMTARAPARQEQPDGLASGPLIERIVRDEASRPRTVPGTTDAALGERRQAVVVERVQIQRSRLPGAEAVGLPSEPRAPLERARRITEQRLQERRELPPGAPPRVRGREDNPRARSGPSRSPPVRVLVPREPPRRGRLER